jgi:putative DNA primase/helicase
MATCPDCGDNKITVEMIKGGIFVCRECSIEQGKKRLAEAQARRASNQTNKLKAKRPKPVPEEDFHGVCNGGCGKRVDGEYTCHDCRNKSTKELFKVRLDEGELWRGAVGKPDDKHEKQVVVRKGVCVSVKPMEWLWQERIPSGAITWIVGQPGNAKSLLTVEIAACASTGRRWPDGSENTLGAVKVLMCCMEDDLEKTVVPRLIAAGADRRNIDFLDDKSFREKIGDILSQKRAIDLDQDMETLLEVIKTNKEYKLMVCDPITGIFGVKSINKDQEVHPILQSLATLCQETGLTFVGVVHTPKRQTNSATEKVAGGSAVAGKCRAAFMLSRDPDSDDKHDHVMTSIKTNLSGVKNGLKYKTVPAKAKDSDPSSPEVDTVRIEWTGTTEDQADDILAKQNAKPEQRDRQADKCEAFLKTFLAKEPRRSTEVYDEAKAQGFGRSTVMRSLKNIGGDHVDRRGEASHGGFWMTLTPGAPFVLAGSEPEKKMALAVGEEL